MNHLSFSLDNQSHLFHLPLAKTQHGDRTSSSFRPPRRKGPSPCKPNYLCSASSLVLFHKLTLFSHSQQQDRELLAPEASEIQIAIQSTGLCGSDLHYFNHYRNGDIIVREPLTLGHESSGTVVSVGSAVTTFAPGDRVALEVGVSCDDCEYCDSGSYNICRGMRFRSSAKSFPHFQGTLQERINHPAKWCHK